MATKIMYLMDYYYEPQGGTEGQVLQLIKYIDRSRYEPSMTLLQSSRFIERNTFPCPVKILGITKLTSIASIWKIIRFCVSLRQSGYRLVHCYFNDVSLIAPPFLKLFGIGVVVSRRDMGIWYTRVNLLVLKCVAPFVDQYIANSNAVKEVVRDKERAQEAKISVIYNGFVFKSSNAESRSHAPITLDIPHSSPVVGIVANLRPIKRLDVLIRAFSKTSSDFPEARLVIVGSDVVTQDGRSIQEELIALARSLGVYELLVFTGSVDDLQPYIKRFTVAVLCSDSEGFSNSIIEYMQAGRPVVCTNTGGNPELVTDGHNGFLVPVGDANALAERLSHLLSDHTMARRMGNTGRGIVRSAYTHTRMVSEHMSLYDTILSVSQGPRRIRRMSVGEGS